MVESRIKQTTESFNPWEDLEPPPLPLPLPPNHGWDNASIQSTPDNSNLQGKSKKVRVVGRSKKIAGRKQKTVFNHPFKSGGRRKGYVTIEISEKILLDYKSEGNVTKHCLNRAYDLLSWEVKLFHVRFVTNNISLRGGGTWVFFGWVCAARDTKLAPCSKKNLP